MATNNPAVTAPGIVPEGIASINIQSRAGCFLLGLADVFEGPIPNPSLAKACRDYAWMAQSDFEAVARLARCKVAADHALRDSTVTHRALEQIARIAGGAK